jgi:hypothetical protein
MDPHLHRELAMVRADEARRHAAGRRRAAASPRRRPFLDLLRRAYVARAAGAPPPPADADVRIRHGRADDAGALARLAALDETAVPRGRVLVAEVGGEPWAARSLATGEVVANPFERTAHLVELLAVRAEQLRAAEDALEERDATSRPLSPSETPAR